MRKKRQLKTITLSVGDNPDLVLCPGFVTSKVFNAAHIARMDPKTARVLVAMVRRQQQFLLELAPDHAATVLADIERLAAEVAK